MAARGTPGRSGWRAEGTLNTRCNYGDLIGGSNRRFYLRPPAAARSAAPRPRTNVGFEFV
jgi:hypothetical protein